MTCVLSLSAVINSLYSSRRASCNSSFFLIAYHKYHVRPQMTTPGKPNPARTSTNDFNKTSKGTYLTSGTLDMHPISVLSPPQTHPAYRFPTLPEWYSICLTKARLFLAPRQLIPCLIKI